MERLLFPHNLAHMSPDVGTSPHSELAEVSEDPLRGRAISARGARLSASGATKSHNPFGVIVRTIDSTQSRRESSRATQSGIEGDGRANP